MFNLALHIARRHALFLVVSMCLLAGFQYLLCVVVSTVNLGAAIEEITKSLPPAVQSLMSEQFFYGLSTRGILAFGWNHPIALALGAAVGIVLAARAIAGEVESGGMELLLSQPLSRSQYLVTQCLLALGVLAIVSFAGIIGTMLGQKVFRLELFGLKSLLKLTISFFLLQSSLFAFTLALSVFGRESGHVATAGFLFALISYLIHVIGRMWSKAAFLLPYSLYNYYSAQAALIDDRLAWKSIAVFVGVFFFSVGFAMWRFVRRDIP